MVVAFAALVHFYPRPPRGGRRSPCRLSWQPRYFYPRPPRGGRLWAVLAERLNHGCISIHALREEGDVGPFRFTASKSDFYPRPPRGGRRKRFKMSASNCPFLSTPSARRATTTRPETGNPEKISIHALREEGDMSSFLNRVWLPEFLSTPSARRATRNSIWAKTAGSDFYPRPPRGGRRSFCSVAIFGC